MSDSKDSKAWAVVEIEQGFMRAQVIKAKLESAGIPVFLSYESIGRVMAIAVDGLGAVRILVPPDRVDEARDLIAEEPEDV